MNQQENQQDQEIHPEPVEKQAQGTPQDSHQHAPATETDIRDGDRSESMIDKIVRDSFPASDPPPWTSTCTE